MTEFLRVRDLKVGEHVLHPCGCTSIIRCRDETKDVADLLATWMCAKHDNLLLENDISLRYVWEVQRLVPIISSRDLDLLPCVTYPIPPWLVRVLEVPSEEQLANLGLTIGVKIPDEDPTQVCMDAIPWAQRHYDWMDMHEVQNVLRLSMETIEKYLMTACTPQALYGMRAEIEYAFKCAESTRGSQPRWVPEPPAGRSFRMPGINVNVSYRFR